ncbi:hypothetical protein CRG98_042337 [Punica granatum]|uniref:G-patch domain-containing protein n=1 Tax=Punica granatum TaxID=22663 RepID=A0A2I0HZX7_PUNGR|nr:hypothetical protein CRG98_042337 [Punica granatum]
MEGPASKGEESSKKVPATSSSSGGMRGREVSVNAVNTAHQASQQYSVNLTSTLPVVPSYAPHAPQYWPQPPTQPIYYSALPPPPPPTVPSLVVHHYAPTPSQAPQYQPPALRASQQGGAAQPPPKDDKVPWTYEGSVGSLEQQLGVMGITRSGRVYENLAVMDKGKAPAAETEVIPGVPGAPPKRVTEEEAEAFMKIIKMNIDLNRVRPSKTVVRAFDGSRKEVNGEIDLLIDVGPCSFSVTFQVLDIPNAFSLLLGRPWIHSAGAIPSSLHQKLKFIVEERIITVKREEDYAIYKETAVPYISVGNDENLPFHSFETISVIRDYGEVGPSRADRMIGKVLLRHNYIPGTGLGARGQAVSRPIEVEEYKHRRGLDFRPSCHEVIEARRGNHLHRLAMHYGRLNRGMQVPPLSHFFPQPLLIIRSTLDGPSSDPDNTPDASPTVFHSNPNHRHVDSNPSEECLGQPRPVYFGEGLDEDSQVPEIEESLHHLEDRQLISVEPTEEINVGTEDEPCTLKIGTGLDLTQRARMIDFLTRYQEVFAWSYADMPDLDPSIVKHFLPLDTEKFPPKRQQLRRQRASLLLLIKEEVVKQINASFLEVCNYSEWVANIVLVEKKDGRVRVYVDYRDLNKASPKDNFPLPYIDILSGKLLGFVVSERGIEVDPDKVKAIKELPPPSSVREVRGFLGRLNYIARFIANLTDKCQPLFRLLRKNAAIEWDEECQKAFDTIKAYLVQPPVLVPPTPGRPLILYLTVCRQSLGCMLGQEEESTHTEHAIYYLSKKFTDEESNYPEIEKMCCALVWVMQRLRQYTLYHTIRLLSKADPLKYLLDSPSSMRNIAKWCCQLTEYDIEYVSRTSVKEQAIADHLAEFPIQDNTPIDPNFPDEGILQVDDEGEKPEWKMYFNGAVNSIGSGIGAVLISPDGRYYPVSAPHFGPPAPTEDFRPNAQGTIHDRKIEGKHAGTERLPNGAPERPDSRTDKRHPKIGLHIPKDHQDHGTGFRLRFGVHLGLPSGSRPGKKEPFSTERHSCRPF